MALRVRERKFALSGDDFNVKDALTGQSIFKVDGKVLSISSRKDILDASGKPLLHLKKKHLHLHQTFDADDPNTKETLATFSKRFALAGSKVVCKFPNKVGGSGEEVELTMRGDFFDRKAEITTEAGVVVGRIGREFLNAGQVFFDKDTYVLTIAPGVDASLLLAFCVVLDETENDGPK